MREIRKRIFTIAILLGIFLYGINPLTETFAAGSYTVQEDAFLYTNDSTGYRIYLSDEEDLLSTDEERALLEEMKPVTAYGNAAFISYYASGVSAKTLAFDAYDALFSNASGTMFLIDMGNREIRIESDGEVYEKISTEKANTITDNVYRYASDGDYYTCASNSFDQILRVLENKPIPQPMKLICNALLALILSLLLNYAIVYSSRNRGKPSMDALLGAMEHGFHFEKTETRLTHRDKTRIMSDGGGGFSGGGHSGGGGGGGHSGGGGGHGF